MSKNLKAFSVPQLLQNKAHLQAHIQKWEGSQNEADFKDIPTETPVSFTYNGKSLSVMMASPVDLIDFGYGFSLSEKIIDHINEIDFIDVIDSDKGLLISMNISERKFNQLSKKSRFSAGMTGCGVCGIESLELLDMPQTKIVSDNHIPHTSIYRAYQTLPEHQIEKNITGAVHAASWCTQGGNITVIREDVGRHNAMDKLIGAAAQNQEDFSKGFCFITSRCSYEIVAKAARVGIPIIAAISAPTSLAVKLAYETGITLIALARNNTFSIFTHEQRITK
jgi:formate dehydrogenase accessory protein FdhD